jgi:hypothetical protein
VGPVGAPGRLAAGKSRAVRWASRAGAGALAGWRWLRARKLGSRGSEVFAVVTAAPALLLTAWLVPGLALVLAGRFTPVPMLLIASPIAVAVLMLAAREAPGRWNVAGRREKERIRARPWAAWWGLAATVVVAAGFAAWQFAENSPHYIVTRDPGAYIQYGYWIAEHGSLPVPQSLAAFGGAHPGLTFSSFGFAGQGGTVVPHFMAGLPVTLAAGLWAHGVSGAALVSPLLGALAVLTVGGLTGRLAGPQWAPAGALVLALTVPEVYTSRSAFSETLAQALLFGGLCLVLDSLTARRPLVLAALGGLAFGLTAAVDPGYLLALVPLILFLGILAAGRRPQALPLAAGLVAGAGYGVITGFVLARPLMSATSPSLPAIGLAAAAVVGVTAAGVAVTMVSPARLRAVKLLAARPLRWLPEAGAVLVTVLALALAIRPYVQRAHGHPNPYIAGLQRLENLPVDPTRLYSEKSLYWIIWYLGVPALLLGVAGLALVTRQCLRALVTWRDPAGSVRAWALPAAVIGWEFFAVLWLPSTIPDQPWASRRLVPVVLPGLIVLAVWVAAWLTSRARARGAGAFAVGAAALCFVAAIGVPAASITFRIGPWSPATPEVRLALTGLAGHRTGTGELTAVRGLCGAIPGRSTVIMVDQVAAREFTQVVRGLCGVPTGVMAGASPTEVQQVIAAIGQAGRRPVLLSGRADGLTPYQAPPRQVVNLVSEQDAHLLTEPPTTAWVTRYALWMSIPGGLATGS